MSINPGEWIVIIVLVLALLGPDRLPDYARTLARLVRGARDFAQRAREQVRDEIGPEFDDIDWQKYDPRRYHPRTIVRNALSEAFDDVDMDVGLGAPGSKPATAGPASPSGRVIRTAAPGNARPDLVKPVSNGGPDAAAPRPAAVAPAVPRAPRNPRPAPLRGSTQPSPPPASWADAVKRPDVDLDAT